MNLKLVGLHSLGGCILEKDSTCLRSLGGCIMVKGNTCPMNVMLNLHLTIPLKYLVCSCTFLGVWVA